MEKENTRLRPIADVYYLHAGNAAFEQRGDFLTLTATLPNDEGVPTTQTYPRIFLHRAFPFDFPESYISVLDREDKEIGFIHHIADFAEETQSLLRRELERKYYAPKITKVHTVKEQYGFAYWDVDTDAGHFMFTLQDIYSSIRKISATRLYIVDVDGNRFEIPDTEALDQASRKKIDIYL